MALARAAISFGSRAAQHAPRCAVAGIRFASAPEAGRRWMSNYYLPSHEYISVKNGTGTVGITDFAQQALGDVVYVELPEVGDTFEKGESFGSVESVKAASDVYAPMSGEVIEVNSGLGDTPGLVNTSPMKDGWFIKLKVSDEGESKQLLDDAKYKQHCDDSKH